MSSNLTIGFEAQDFSKCFDLPPLRSLNSIFKLNVEKARPGQCKRTYLATLSHGRTTTCHQHQGKLTMFSNLCFAVTRAPLPSPHNFWPSIVQENTTSCCLNYPPTALFTKWFHVRYAFFHFLPPATMSSALELKLGFSGFNIAFLIICLSSSSSGVPCLQILLSTNIKVSRCKILFVRNDIAGTSMVAKMPLLRNGKPASVKDWLILCNGFSVSSMIVMGEYVRFWT